ncbi:hypothetical protein BU14_0236s0013 [Porphyra umbilicalis]|uniref:Uncharacterized protein n=1 Tax=Porphyra umbilicalis TaxID=2786 RepID=A0A1X6P3W6_PORUM|nr:hypothetical protein BU14_0236s0013 [Porphyra umbilicalis]|eukprot:OSX75450.1 hypothetical protein BU14_0236s0013 [Porphyra umbilicalis]
MVYTRSRQLHTLARRDAQPTPEPLFLLWWHIADVPSVVFLLHLLQSPAGGSGVGLLRTVATPAAGGCASAPRSLFGGTNPTWPLSGGGRTLGAMAAPGGEGGVFGGAAAGECSSGLNGALPPMSGGGGLIGAPGLATSTALASRGGLFGALAPAGLDGDSLFGAAGPATSSAGGLWGGASPGGVAPSAITCFGVSGAADGARPPVSSGAPLPLCAASSAAFPPHTRFAALPATIQNDLLTVERHLRDQRAGADRLAEAVANHDAASSVVNSTTRRVGRAVSAASAAVADARSAVQEAAAAAVGERSAARRVIPLLTHTGGKAARAADAAAARDLEAHWSATGTALAERTAICAAAMAGARDAVAAATACVYGGVGGGAACGLLGGVVEGTPPLQVDVATQVDAALRAQVERLMGVAADTVSVQEVVDALRGSWLGFLRHQAERDGAAGGRGALSTHVVDPFRLAARREAADVRRGEADADAAVAATVAAAGAAAEAGWSATSSAAMPATSTAAAPSPAGGGGLFGGGAGGLRVGLDAPTSAALANGGRGLWGTPPVAAAAAKGGGGLFGGAPAPTAGTSAAIGAAAMSGGGGLFGFPANAASAAGTSAAAPAGSSSLFGGAAATLPSLALGMGVAASAPAPAGGGGLFSGGGMSLGVGGGTAALARAVGVPPEATALPPLQLGGGFGTAVGGLGGVPATPAQTSAGKRRTFVGGGGSRRKK